MVTDEHVVQVLWAIERLEGRVRATTATEISFLVPIGSDDLEHALRRAVVGGWLIREVVQSGGERTGVRTGDTVYRLTDMAEHRVLVA